MKRICTIFHKAPILVALLLFALWPSLSAQRLGLKNMPYVDQRRFHYGFSLGLNFTDIAFCHSGQEWYAEVPSVNPAFCVGLLGDLALTERLNVRCAPTLFFQSREVKFLNNVSQETRNQALKTTYLEIPLSLKISTHRLNNYRPYMLGGMGIDIDMTHEKETPIVFQRVDVSLHAAIGCDTYLPFFKLCPELRFNLGLADMLDHKRKNLKDETLRPFTDALSSARNRSVSLIFFFE